MTYSQIGLCIECRHERIEGFGFFYKYCGFIWKINKNKNDARSTEEKQIIQYLSQMYIFLWHIYEVCLLFCLGNHFTFNCSFLVNMFWTVGSWVSDKNTFYIDQASLIILNLIPIFKNIFLNIYPPKYLFIHC